MGGVSEIYCAVKQATQALSRVGTYGGKGGGEGRGGEGSKEHEEGGGKAID